MSWKLFFQIVLLIIIAAVALYAVNYFSNLAYSCSGCMGDLPPMSFPQP